MTTTDAVPERAAKRGYDAVLFVHDYHDGPRSGVAYFHGSPHYFECIFDDSLDEYSESYRLLRLTPESLKLARESWAIFLRWKAAFDSGTTDLSTHPALPEDTAKYRINRSQLQNALDSGRSSAVCARGCFAPMGDSGPLANALTPWQVRWSDS
jgi:hypothetical protein